MESIPPALSTPDVNASLVPIRGITGIGDGTSTGGNTASMVYTAGRMSSSSVK